jgi:hypothetical protein
MKLHILVFTAIFGLLSWSILVSAQAAKKQEPEFADSAKKFEQISTESSLKQYVVTFHDEISGDDFSEVSKWITDNKGEIVESINEHFAKLIIAKSDPSIRIYI